MEDSNSQKPKVFLKIVDRPNDAIQKLFSHECNKVTKPLECRNLPKSFFTPPQEENHTILHRKSNSSPCPMGQAPFQSMDIVEHSRQKSLDAPHNTVNLFHRTNISSELDETVITPLTSSIGPLPDYFEMTINENNQVYFLNHRDGETTWFDPRIPPEDQTYGMSLKDLDKLHANFVLKQKLKKNTLESAKRIGNLSPPMIAQGCETSASLSNASCFQRIEASNCPPIACSLGFHNNVRPSSVPRIQHLISNTGKGPNQTTNYSRQSTTNSQNMCMSPNGSLPPAGDQRLIGHHITHTKSSSQPVTMSTDHHEYFAGDCLHPSAWNPATNLSTSMSGIFDDYSHPSTSSMTNSTSSHLAQHLEDLNLATKCPVIQLHRTCSDTSECMHANESCMSSLHFQQNQQQYQNLFSVGRNIPAVNDVKLSSTCEHSHQNSLDSGVGKSIAGHSVHSSTQASLHLNDMFCNSDMDRCNASWCNQMNYYMTDQSNSAMEGGSDLQRSQHC